MEIVNTHVSSNGNRYRNLNRPHIYNCNIMSSNKENDTERALIYFTEAVEKGNLDILYIIDIRYIIET